MEKTVIITGVTGQDGSYMADYLLEATPYRILGVTRRHGISNFSNIEHAMKNARFQMVSADLTDSAAIDSLIRDHQPDYFINFAAMSFVKESWNTPESTFDINTLGVVRILEGIRKHKPNCRFYSAGSSEELGDVVYTPQDLEHPLRPRSPYGASKAAARHVVKVYRESYGLYAIHCILFNHESERRGIEFVTRKITRNIARIKHALDADQPFVPLELGNLEAKRDWSHSYDFMKAVWLMLNQPEPREYLLSSNETHTVREFLEKAFAAAGIDIKQDVSGICEYYEASSKSPVVTLNPKYLRPAEVDLLYGDSNIARKQLNWKPEIPFEELVSRMVKHDIAHYDPEHEWAL